jgi:two-component system response regulator RegX3
MRILVVEDEPLLRDGLLDLLRGAGHEVEAAGDGERAVLRGTEGAFDLVLLDLMLPLLDGIEVCRRVRRARPGIPVLMLTARGSEDDKVTGLEAGADDYVTKPFGARELLARVEALGRRSRTAVAQPEVVEADGCRVDLGRCQAERDGATVSLTAREAGILRLLHRQRARAVTRAELLEQVWGMRPDIETRTVDVTIGNLRQKIERDPARPVIVVSVKGVGYAWGPGDGRDPARGPRRS